MALSWFSEEKSPTNIMGKSLIKSASEIIEENKQLKQEVDRWITKKVEIEQKLEAVREIKQELVDVINTVYDGVNVDDERDHLLKTLEVLDK
jgi:hypothetical protein